MLSSRSFGLAEPYPETTIALLDIRGDSAYLGVQSFLGTRTFTNSEGHTRSFRVRPRIQPGSLYEDIVTDLIDAMRIERCQALAPDGSGGWHVVRPLPPRNYPWAPADAFDLVDRAAPQGFALAVPFAGYSTISSFPATSIPGLAGNWLILELN